MHQKCIKSASVIGSIFVGKLHFLNKFSKHICKQSEAKFPGRRPEVKFGGCSPWQSSVTWPAKSQFLFFLIGLKWGKEVQGWGVASSGLGYPINCNEKN